ncbi:hypothetical protein DYBT9275_00342 [Dyadobacter sp. CECT 9275]|uniref:Lipoprotein n=1 Tax=Dyadobacter helix TaxID=2822344 RepID=A0A916J8A4_9BACT|nr:hypothetical protein [Dyadobacter sp. CECT 9275]CAG4989679.1 hypothetical protein DYBT9275_00342 [Dyadobacter sp. CECT 9275]
MKIQKNTLQAIAVAVAVTAVTAACAVDNVGPKEKQAKTKVIDNCPACGLG